MDLISGSVDQTSSPQAKIALFRSLFRGRDDVYPRRFESRKTGRSGTLPPVPTSGSVACARSRASNALNVPTVGSFRSLTTSFAGTCQVATPRDSPSSLASTRCFRTRPASSSPSISTRPAGATMPRRFLKRVATSTSQPRSNDHAPGEARMSGSSSKRPFQPRLPDDWDRMSHRDNGEASGHRSRFMRPAVSESRHDAARRIWKPHRSAAPEGGAQTGQHGLS